MMPRIQKMKEKLGKEEVSATSASGQITICMSGSGSVTRIEMASELANLDDKTSIEAQLIETINKAIQQAKSLHLKAVREVVDDLGIPGIDRMLEQLAE